MFCNFVTLNLVALTNHLTLSSVIGFPWVSCQNQPVLANKLSKRSLSLEDHQFLGSRILINYFYLREDFDLRFYHTKSRRNQLSSLSGLNNCISLDIPIKTRPYYQPSFLTRLILERLLIFRCTPLM